MRYILFIIALIQPSWTFATVPPPASVPSPENLEVRCIKDFMGHDMAQNEAAYEAAMRLCRRASSSEPVSCFFSLWGKEFAQNEAGLNLTIDICTAKHPSDSLKCFSDVWGNVFAKTEIGLSLTRKLCLADKPAELTKCFNETWDALGKSSASITSVMDICSRDVSR